MARAGNDFLYGIPVPFSENSHARKGYHIVFPAPDRQYWHTKFFQTYMLVPLILRQEPAQA